MDIRVKSRKIIAEIEAIKEIEGMTTNVEVIKFLLDEHREKRKLETEMKKAPALT